MNEITINGEVRRIAEGTRLSDLLRDLELPGSRIAVELNKNVVRKKSWPETRLSDKDVIEVIHFVGGG